MLSALGHWVYVSLRSIDRTVSTVTYRSPGSELVWVGHGVLEDSIQRAQQRWPTKELVTNVEIDTLSVLPVSSFWLTLGCAFTFAAAIMVWSAGWTRSHAIQSLIGLMAGHALWFGAVEIGLDLVSRRLGLAGSLDLVGGRVVGVHGTGILIQCSIVFLAPVLIGLTLHESNRCVVFQWFRRIFPLTVNTGASGKVDNYAARTMTQYFMTVWVCYVAVLWMADPQFEGWRQTMLLLSLGAIVVATPYMVWKTTYQKSRGQMLRYSVSGAVVTWTGIEIASAMGMFAEPWLNESPIVGVCLISTSLALTFIAVALLSNFPSRRTCD